MNLAYFRREFMRSELDEKTLPPAPFPLFAHWLEEAMKEEKYDANAMVLSTAGKDNIPSSRIVLLKEYSEKGLVFFTNYTSRKAGEIDLNPLVSLLFYWPVLERQVRVEGVAEKISNRESDAYFDSRPEGSKLAVWTSRQSAQIPDRETLEKRFEQYRKEFTGMRIPRPPEWGGYLVIPQRIEFWQGRENRLHDRIEYYYSQGRWSIRRLAP